ncbi:MAG: DUF1648 domain-containing protein [archaeon]
MKAAHWIIIAIIVISFIIGIYYYPQFPEEVASHWNTQGEVDDYMPKFWGLFLMPIISVGLFILFLWLPNADPYKENYKSFQNYFDGFIVILVAFLFYIYLLTIAWTLGFTANIGQLLTPAFGVLIYYCGVLISKAKRNWFVGIRNAWTLSSDKVWDKTHKLGGTLFKIAAVIAVIGGFFPEGTFWFVLLPIIAVVVIVFVYSYLVYKKTVTK